MSKYSFIKVLDKMQFLTLLCVLTYFNAKQRERMGFRECSVYSVSFDLYIWTYSSSKELLLFVMLIDNRYIYICIDKDHNRT